MVSSGVASSNKFLQKIWNLNVQILSKKNKINKELMNKFNLEIDSIAFKIDKSIEEFKFNVTFPFYEIYRVF